MKKKEASCRYVESSFFFSSRRRHTRYWRDWSSDVCSSDLSLRRMGTDWIDLYQFHHVDLRTPWDEIWQACETLVAHGKVLYVGSSNHAAWQIRSEERRVGKECRSRWSPYH